MADFTAPDSEWADHAEEIAANFPGDIILTPAQLTSFAEVLYNSIQRLRSEGRKMRESTKAARVVWKDEKYDNFHKQLESCVENLERFNNTGIKYSEFLKEKADLANKYLHRR